MKAKLFFIESSKEFSKSDKKKITDLTQKVFIDASKILGVTSHVNFTFYRFGKDNGAFTEAKDWISLTIPKGKINYADLKGVLYHEIHHTVRGYSGYQEKKHYLLNSLFSEGLAVAFEFEKQPKNKKYAEYTLALVRKWLPKTKKELFRKHYSHAVWFLGDGRPNRLGYKLGKYLVDQINKHHPELSHKDLVQKDAKDLLKLSKVKI